MSFPLVLALGIMTIAVAFHLHWASGGKIGYSVSLPQRRGGEPVLAHRIGWWRVGAAGVVLALALLAILTLAVAGVIPIPMPTAMSRLALTIAGVVLASRAIVPTPWTGFFKTIRTTRWARYDTRFYSPLFLMLGLSLIAVASGY